MGWRGWCLGIGILLMLAANIMFIVLKAKDDKSETNRIIDVCLSGAGVILFCISFVPKTDSGRAEIARVAEIAERASAAAALNYQ